MDPGWGTRSGGVEQDNLVWQSVSRFLRDVETPPNPGLVHIGIFYSLVCLIINLFVPVLVFFLVE